MSSLVTYRTNTSWCIRILRLVNPREMLIIVAHSAILPSLERKPLFDIESPRRRDDRRLRMVVGVLRTLISNSEVSPTCRCLSLRTAKIAIFSLTASPLKKACGPGLKARSTVAGDMISSASVGLSVALLHQPRVKGLRCCMQYTCARNIVGEWKCCLNPSLKLGKTLRTEESPLGYDVIYSGSTTSKHAAAYSIFLML